MKINFTKKQYESLAKIVYLGNWMANAQRTGSKDDSRLQEYDEIAECIFSLSPMFGLPENYENEIEFSDDDSITEVSRLHEEYDEDMFFDELPHRLGERDFYKKYTPEQIEKMTEEERFIKLMECEIAWETEFETYGIERIGIVDMEENLQKWHLIKNNLIKNPSKKELPNEFVGFEEPQAENCSTVE